MLDLNENLPRQGTSFRNRASRLMSKVAGSGTTSLYSGLRIQVILVCPVGQLYSSEVQELQKRRFQI
jgi:hypothetical protein